LNCGKAVALEYSAENNGRNKMLADKKTFRDVKMSTARCLKRDDGKTYDREGTVIQSNVISCTSKVLDDGTIHEGTINTSRSTSSYIPVQQRDTAKELVRPPSQILPDLNKVTLLSQGHKAVGSKSGMVPSELIPKKCSIIARSEYVKPKLFPLLMLVVFWCSFVIDGTLSTVISYACYSTGIVH